MEYLIVFFAKLIMMFSIAWQIKAIISRAIIPIIISTSLIGTCQILGIYYISNYVKDNPGMIAVYIAGANFGVLANIYIFKKEK